MRLQTCVQTDTLQGAIKIINPLMYDFCSKLSWFKADLTKKSLRFDLNLDLWLISDNLASLVRTCNITAAPLTDHAGIDISISNSNSPCRSKPGYWKLNASFLQQ